MSTVKNLSAAILILISSVGISQERLTIESWVTKPDRQSLFEKQKDTLYFGTDQIKWMAPLIVDPQQQFQSMDGFGFALTGGSAGHIIRMNSEARNNLLQELFNVNNTGISYLRISIGASDLNDFVFSYDDLKPGETDFDLEKFDLSQDKKDIIPVLKQILAINPDIKILGSPWSAPAWMKTNNDVRGGALKPECYDVYARYFVKYIQAMKKEGIQIDAITFQNEPLNSRNTPSMQWYVTEQSEFIKKHLGPEFRKAGIKTKIVLYDHNCDRAEYPLTLMNDPEISQYVDGSGFHHYGGDLSAMSFLHMARPDKNIYFTEQMVTEKPGSSSINIAQSVKRLIIDVTRNWSKNVILWNLAADSLNDPHTDNGGCSMCQGAVTIDGDRVIRNLAYYTIAHASKFVKPGSVRINSTDRNDKFVRLTEDEERPGVFRYNLENADILPNVAFKTPDGNIVLIVANDSWSKHSFRIQYNGQFAVIKLEPGAVGTYIWKY